MALNAGHSRVVVIRFDTGDALPLTGRVRKAGMTAETNLAAAVDIEFFRLFRVVERRAVAVFTRNDAMQVFGADRNFLAMAFPA
jgi:hypothetical protein